MKNFVINMFIISNIMLLMKMKQIKILNQKELEANLRVSIKVIFYLISLKFIFFKILEMKGF